MTRVRLGELRTLKDLILARKTTRSEIVAFQERQLRQLVQHASLRVPYYRRLFASAGIGAGDIQSLEDLHKLPITNRADIQSLPKEEICAEGWEIDRLRVVHTSGSSGTPITIRRTSVEQNLLLGYRIKAMQGCGLGLTARRVQIDYFSQHTLRTEAPPRIWERCGVLPRLLLDWRTPKAQMVDRIARFRPDVLSGPPSVLSWVADSITEEDRLRMGFRVAVVGAETVTPLMRQQIEIGFGAPVAEVYGSHEVVFIAMRRPGREAYRVCEEATIVEVLKDGRPALPGERGEVVVTALHSFAMPFIRYRLGDEVTLGDSPNEADPYLSIRSIDGRTIERFVLPDGRALHPYSLSAAFRGIAALRRFQIVQTRPNRILVRVVLYQEVVNQDKQEQVNEATLNSVIDQVRQGVEKVVGNDVTVQVQVTDSLQPVAGEKFRTYVSLERYRSSHPGNVEPDPSTA